MSCLKTVCLTLIAQIDGAIARSITGTVGTNKIRCQLCIIMIFILPLFNGLNKRLRLNITDEALLDKSLVLNLESDIGILSSNTSINEERGKVNIRLNKWKRCRLCYIAQNLKKSHWNWGCPNQSVETLPCYYAPTLQPSIFGGIRYWINQSPYDCLKTRVRAGPSIWSGLENRIKGFGALPKLGGKNQVGLPGFKDCGAEKGNCSLLTIIRRGFG